MESLSLLLIEMRFHNSLQITRELEEFVGTNWVDFSSLITKFKDENKLDESFKKRLNTLLTLLSSLENKAHTKNDWVNEFKQYIIDNK